MMANSRGAICLCGREADAADERKEPLVRRSKMGNPEHVKIISQGAKATRAWRDRNPGVRLELSEARLSGADLIQGELRGADLKGADLTFAKLNGASLAEADLSCAFLGEAWLVAADLGAANLNEADLSGADLRMSCLSRADLRGAGLAWANLFEADLSGADLSGAFLGGAGLRSANMSGADLHGAFCTGTVFADVDLSLVKGLEAVVHNSPSTVGIDAIIKSKGKIPEVFLRGCGVPEPLIKYLHSLPGEAFEFFSCFISYAEADNAFSELLYNDLRAAGVKCWRWKEDAKWGRKLMREVDQAIERYDKLVVILSELSLKSEPVIREIERALQKEQREGKEVLFPIRLDEAIFSWHHELKADIVRKHIGDFRNWKDPDSYNKARDRLVGDLGAEK